MKKEQLTIPYFVVTENELSEEDRQLVELAKSATRTSFSPYSHFSVGAAVRLSNGKFLHGSNQENASYTTGTCAERCTVFYANARYPEAAVEVIAIVARREDGRFTPFPVSPCGACRQVLAEVEHRFKKPMRVLLFGADEIYIMESVGQLLPMQFNADSL